MNSRTKILVNKKATFGNLLLMILFLTVSGPALASTTWYVNGVSGSDKNHCMSPATAGKTIGHAILRAHAGDSIMVAAATYTENLTIGINLNVIGSGASKTQYPKSCSYSLYSTQIMGQS
jgi:hypothetical protein